MIHLNDMVLSDIIHKFSQDFKFGANPPSYHIEVSLLDCFGYSHWDDFLKKNQHINVKIPKRILLVHVDFVTQEKFPKRPYNEFQSATKVFIRRNTNYSRSINNGI